MDGAGSRRFFEFWIDAFAVFRLTRLVVADTITADLRNPVIEMAYRRARRRPPPVEQPAPDLREAVIADPDPPKPAKLITCGWCAGMWIAFGVMLARRFAPRFWSPVSYALAIAGGSGFAAAFLERQTPQQPVDDTAR